MTLLRKIIYISGSGRSGSTLLERVLHSADGVCAVGELHCLWRLPAEAITCACGARFRADRRWADVLAAARFDAATLAELAQLEADVCRTGTLVRHRFSLASLRADPAVQRFLALQMRLFEAIAEVSASPVVVDSSKAGPRAWLLACDPRVTVLHLHRDPTDVIASWRSAKYDPGLGTAMKRMPVHSAALDWWKVDRLAAMLARVQPVLRVDYAALCNAPEAVLAQVLDQLDLPAGVAPRWISPGSVAQGADYHSLNGNPDRFAAGPLTIVARRVDFARLPPVDRVLVRAAGAALRRVSGHSAQHR